MILMTAKKMPKIEGLEKLLSNKTPDEQRELRALIEAEFAGVDMNDPSTLPGRPVRTIPDGVQNCPDCRTKFTNSFTMQLPSGVGGGDLDGKLVQIVDCAMCDCSFVREAKS